MLQLCAEQVEVFMGPVMARLCERIHVHLQTHHPDRIAGLPDPEVRSRIAEATARARGFGLTWELSLVDFTTLAFQLGQGFHAQPDMKDALDRVAEEAEPDLAFASLLGRVNRETGRIAAPLYWED